MKMHVKHIIIINILILLSALSCHATQLFDEIRKYNYVEDVDGNKAKAMFETYIQSTPEELKKEDPRWENPDIRIYKDLANITWKLWEKQQNIDAYAKH